MTTQPTSPQAARPTPLNSITASAARLTSRTVKRVGTVGKEQAGWQDEAWDAFDQVGEQRFLANTIAQRVGQARLYVGKMTDNPADPPEPLDDPEHELEEGETPDPLDAQAQAVFDLWGGSQSQRQQLNTRMALNLFVAGDGWYAGIPKHLLAAQAPVTPGNPAEGITPIGRAADQTEPGIDLDSLVWRMLSSAEVSIDATIGRVTIRTGEGDGEKDKIECAPEEVFLIRVWRAHPRKWWLSDSPVRSSLPVLRELIGLTMHVSAQVDSRLAGAGVFIVPQSAKNAMMREGGPLTDGDDDDPFTEALIDAMVTPISDRSNASAVVPLVVVVPDDVADKFQHIKFSTNLDAEARGLREEAIRRLALGEDAPPELLLGTGGMNHWGAWLVREDVVTVHVEPPTALICDAVTTQYLWPVLIEQGMTEEEAHRYVVWYDVSHLIARPNRSSDALSVHGAGALSDEALRREGGFDDEDAPPPQSVQDIVLGLIAQAPTLTVTPGIPALTEQITALLAGAAPPDDTPDDTAPVEEPSGADEQGPPTTSDQPAPEMALIPPVELW